jgi:hypothetical protein
MHNSLYRLAVWAQKGGEIYTYMVSGQWWSAEIAVIDWLALLGHCHLYQNQIELFIIQNKFQTRHTEGVFLWYITRIIRCTLQGITFYLKTMINSQIGFARFIGNQRSLPQTMYYLEILTEWKCRGYRIFKVLS